MRKPPNYWTKEKCKEEALKYNLKKEFEKNGGAYSASIKNGWYDDITSHMKQLKKPKGYWVYKTCKEEAKKYKTRSEFKLKNITAYNKSCKLNIIDEICYHMIPQSRNIDRYIYVFEFISTNSVYVGLTWNLKQRYNKHINPKKGDTLSTVYKYIQENKYVDYKFKKLGYYDVKTSMKKKASG